MSQPYLGQIIQVGFGFAPQGWQTCSGQTLSIQQNNALFAILGTTFGGNGVQTFGLPDVQGRVLVGVGNGAGLSSYVWGERGGMENETLTIAILPPHTHTATFTPSGGGGGPTTLQALSGVPTASVTAIPAQGSQLANAFPTGPNQPRIYAPAGSGTAVNLGGISGGGISGGTVTNAMTGNNQFFSLLQPYLAVYSCIAMQGLFPSRN